MEGSNAKFRLRNYVITEFSFKVPDGEDQALNIKIDPSGEFNPADSIYHLFLAISCNTENSKEQIIQAKLEAHFQLSENENKIPKFFYANSIAILFPYIRAFVSTISLQSNSGHIMLPTLNLTKLGPDLEKNTTIL